MKINQIDGVVLNGYQELIAAGDRAREAGLYGEAKQYYQHAVAMKPRLHLLFHLLECVGVSGGDEEGVVIQIGKQILSGEYYYQFDVQFDIVQRLQKLKQYQLALDVVTLLNSRNGCISGKVMAIELQLAINPDQPPLKQIKSLIDYAPIHPESLNYQKKYCSELKRLPGVDQKERERALGEIFDQHKMDQTLRDYIVDGVVFEERESTRYYYWQGIFNELFRAGYALSDQELLRIIAFLIKFYSNYNSRFIWNHFFDDDRFSADDLNDVFNFLTPEFERFNVIYNAYIAIISLYYQKNRAAVEGFILKVYQHDPEQFMDHLKKLPWDKQIVFYPLLEREQFQWIREQVVEKIKADDYRFHNFKQYFDPERYQKMVLERLGLWLESQGCTEEHYVTIMGYCNGEEAVDFERLQQIDSIPEYRKRYLMPHILEPGIDLSDSVMQRIVTLCYALSEDATLIQLLPDLPSYTTIAQLNGVFQRFQFLKITPERIYQLLSSKFGYGYGVFSSTVHLNRRAIIKLWCEHHFNIVLEDYHQRSVYDQRTMIPLIWGVAPDLFFPVVKKQIDALKKHLFKATIPLFQNYPGGKKIYFEWLKSSKQDLRLFALDILGEMAIDDRDLQQQLREAMGNERGKKVKTLWEKLNHHYTISALPEGVERNRLLLQFYIKEQAAGYRRGLFPSIDLERFAAMKWLNDDTELNDKELQYLIKLMADLNQEYGKKLAIPGTIKLLPQVIDRKQLKDFGMSLYKQWNRKKERFWMAGFIQAFIDDSDLPLLQKELMELGNNRKYVLSERMVELIAARGSKEALQTLQAVHGSVKSGKVKGIIQVAIDRLAAENGGSRAALLEAAIPDFGFDQYGVQYINYGPRQFSVTIRGDLSLEIKNDQGKLLKNMPPVGKRDDQVVAKAAREQFTRMKKGVTEQKRVQSLRLEQLMGQAPELSIDGWQQYYLNHPIMRYFTIYLVWGIYSDGVLQQTLRGTVDGELVDQNDEPVELPESGVIGVVQRAELDDETSQRWVEQFKDYELEQPFGQLERKIFTPESVVDGQIFDFQGFMVPRLFLYQQMTRHRWARSEREDDGYFKHYFLTDQATGIRCDLHFKGDSFKKANHFKEEPLYGVTYFNRDGAVIDFNTVPVRFLQETLHRIQQVAHMGSGFNPEWENC